MKPRPWTAQEVETLARMYAGGSTLAEIGKAVGRSIDMVNFKRRHLGFATRDNARAIPNDFAEVASQLSLHQLAGRFDTSVKTAAKWRHKLGIVYAPPVRIVEVKPSRPRAISAPKPSRQIVAKPSNKRPRHPASNAPQAAPLSAPDMSEHGQAADHLRRDGWPVHRCDDTGTANPKGYRYRVGSMILTPADMLAMAKRKGFARWDAFTPSNHKTAGHSLDR